MGKANYIAVNGDEDVKALISKGFKNIFANLKSDMYGGRPFIVTEHDYKDVLRWTQMEAFDASLPYAPRDNSECNR